MDNVRTEYRLGCVLLSQGELRGWHHSSCQVYYYNMPVPGLSSLTINPTVPKAHSHCPSKHNIRYPFASFSPLLFPPLNVTVVNYVCDILLRICTITLLHWLVYLISPTMIKHHNVITAWRGQSLMDVVQSGWTCTLQRAVGVESCHLDMFADDRLLSIFTIDKAHCSCGIRWVERLSE